MRPLDPSDAPLPHWMEHTAPVPPIDDPPSHASEVDALRNAAQVLVATRGPFVEAGARYLRRLIAEAERAHADTVRRPSGAGESAP